MTGVAARGQTRVCLSTREQQHALTIVGAGEMPMHVYIENIGKHEGEQVTIKGWLHGRRSSGKIHFLTLRDGSGFIQGVMSPRHARIAAAREA